MVHFAGVMAQRRLIAAVDIGSTTVRCCIYDVNERPMRLVTHAARPVTSIHPEAFSCEIVPEHLWQVFVGVVRDAIDGENAWPCDNRSTLAHSLGSRSIANHAYGHQYA